MATESSLEVFSQITPGAQEVTGFEDVNKRITHFPANTVKEDIRKVEW